MCRFGTSVNAPRWVCLLPLLWGPGAASSAEVVVSRAAVGFEVRAWIEAPAPIDSCYAVLTDFERLAEFIPDMQSSRIVSAPGEPLLLRQVGRTRFAFFELSFDVTLALELDPPSRVGFRRVAGSLVRMEGDWRISGDGSGCRIDYGAIIAPDVFVPPLIGPALMRRQVRRQLEGIEAEIARRAGEG
jgi:hypothetical protein